MNGLSLLTALIWFTWSKDIDQRFYETKPKYILSLAYRENKITNNFVPYSGFL